jgi:hypothetical protein
MGTRASVPASLSAELQTAVPPGRTDLQVPPHTPLCAVPSGEILKSREFVPKGDGLPGVVRAGAQNVGVPKGVMFVKKASLPLAQDAAASTAAPALTQPPPDAR